MNISKRKFKIDASDTLFVLTFKSIIILMWKSDMYFLEYMSSLPFPIIRVRWTHLSSTESIFFLRTFGSVRLTSETALTLVIWCPGRNCMWLLRCNLRIDNGSFFHSGECSPFAHAAGLFQNEEGTSMNKYYLSSDDWRFAIFKGKCIISEEKMEVNLLEMSQEKIYQAWHILCFTTRFMPIAWVPQCLSHWELKECLGKQIHLPNLCFVLSLRERQAGRLCLVPPHTPSLCEPWCQKKWLKTTKEGKAEVLVGLGGQKVIRTLLGELRECVHTGHCIRSYFMSRQLFEIV